ncbi:hypothetical protein FNF27_03138 [Cafeteria roenbergensis]|uniref:Lipoyl-binding domain-containing protein n=1 Tax=Cafeteria roenbergensis TaxID=33653 RepID=A0A5A8EDU9_CAFRO|nr:hypothetical protein FNF27_03138 [Cafeteria roenbergensis]
MAVALRESPFFARCMSSFPEHTIVRMPSLSPTMEAGNLVEWLVAEGGEFAAGDELASIQTDKAEVSLEATDDGFLAKILVQGGTDDIPISTPIAVTVDDADLLDAFKEFTVDDAPPAKASPAASGYVAFERWGRSLSRSAAGGALIGEQANYVAEFGATGMEDPSIADEETA